VSIRKWIFSDGASSINPALPGGNIRERIPRPEIPAEEQIQPFSASNGGMKYLREQKTRHSITPTKLSPLIATSLHAMPQIPFPVFKLFFPTEK
jgi:hypothetical protein